MSTSTGHIHDECIPVVLDYGRRGPRIRYVPTPSTVEINCHVEQDPPPEPLRGAKRGKKNKRKKDWQI